MIPRLSELKFSKSTAQPLNVCVVSSEFLGPVKNGGIGTATSGLVRQLAADGHKTTLLYTLVENGIPASGDKPWEFWVDDLSRHGITVKHIPHPGNYRAWREKSWHVKEFIAKSNFDVVYFNEHHGSGYYSLLANRAGLSPFADQLHCIITHGSMEWVFDVNDQYTVDTTDIVMMGLERRSVELADVVIGPSHYLLRQYKKYGWQLPTHTFVQPYPLLQTGAIPTGSKPLKIDELVFFGRLETRKGLWLFCEALEHLGDRMSGKVATFLGKMTDTSGVSSGFQIVNRSSKWPFRVKLLPDFDQEEALSYLQQPGRLAVMPSLADNSPCVVYECMEAGIPFLATRGSGADELVDPDCWDEIMVEPSVPSLANGLARILEHGASLGRPRFHPRENLAVWSAWHSHLAAQRTQLKVPQSDHTKPASAVNEAPGKIPLIVVIDNGCCSLSLLMDNLSSHIKRFGKRAAYLVLSSRRGHLQDVLFDIFNASPDSTPTSICGSYPEALAEAKKMIVGSSVVFFTDAETEILTSFFVLANKILGQNEAAIVSCAVATKYNDQTNPEIEDLPTGGIPGLSNLGYPIGGAVWGVSTANLTDDLCALELYEQSLDHLNSSWKLGQILMQRCLVSKIPIQVLPMVGAIKNCEDAWRQDQLHFKDMKTLAALSGINPTVYSGGAAWFAVSRFGSFAQDAAQCPMSYSSFLPAEHPMHPLQMKGKAFELSELAATQGRIELALQLEAEADPSPERLQHLVDLATTSTRLAPRTDLNALLSSTNILKFGQHAIPEWVQSETTTYHHGKPPDRQGSESAQNDNRISSREQFSNFNFVPRVYVDERRIAIKSRRVQAITSLTSENPGRVSFFDVPLRGNSTLSGAFRTNSTNPVFLTVKILDQLNGEMIGTKHLQLGPKEISEVSISLYCIYGSAAVILELAGNAKADLMIEWLQIA